MATHSSIFEAKLQLTKIDDNFSTTFGMNVVNEDVASPLFEIVNIEAGVFMFFINNEEFDVAIAITGNQVVFNQTNRLPDGVYEFKYIFAPLKNEDIARPYSDGDLVSYLGNLYYMSGGEFVEVLDIKELLEVPFLNQQQVINLKVAFMPCSLGEYKLELKDLSEKVLNGLEAGLIKDSDCDCESKCSINNIFSKIAAYNALVYYNWIMEYEDIFNMFNIFSYKKCCSCCDKITEPYNPASLLDDCPTGTYYIEGIQRTLRFMKFTLPEDFLIDVRNNEVSTLELIINFVLYNETKTGVIDILDIAEGVDGSPRTVLRSDLMEAIKDSFSADLEVIVEQEGDFFIVALDIPFGMTPNDRMLQSIVVSAKSKTEDTVFAKFIKSLIAPSSLYSGISNYYTVETVYTLVNSKYILEVDATASEERFINLEVLVEDKWINKTSEIVFEDADSRYGTWINTNPEFKASKYRLVLPTNNKEIIVETGEILIL